jgi:hypothetical protein
VCYSRYWEGEEARKAQQQAKDREVQAKRGDRINTLLTEAKKLKTAYEKIANREVASAE